MFSIVYELVTGNHFFCLKWPQKKIEGGNVRQTKISRETEGGKVGKQKHLTANSADP